MAKLETLQVRLWDQVVGYLAAQGRGPISFEYEATFKARGLEIAPVEMRLATTTVYRSREVGSTFLGLPGVFADALPDHYGMRVIEKFFKQRLNLAPEHVGVLERLLYLGDRAIGALEFHPALDSKPQSPPNITLPEILTAANRMIAGKADIKTIDLLRVSGSAGGRHAKALVDFNPRTKDLRDPFAPARKGFVPCLLKLDGARDGDEPNTYGRLEFVYAELARRCGIRIPRTFLLEAETPAGPSAHFLVERIDRSLDKDKPAHFASLCGLLLRDYKLKHSCSYEDYLRLTQHLTSDAEQVAEALRRAAFNIVFRNQDDHTKNFGFLMDREGVWRLAPAFDLTYVYGYGVAATHQMTLAGKDDEFAAADLFAVAKQFGVKRRYVVEIMERCAVVAGEFVDLAAKAGLEENFAAGVRRNFRILVPTASTSPIP